MNLIKHIGLLACVLFACVQKNFAQVKQKPIDGVIAVVGPHIILESDIEKFYLEGKMKQSDMSEVTSCQLLGSMLENKMFAHHAVQDSLVVTDQEVNDYIDGQFDRMVEYAGSLENVVKMYKKKNVEDLRSSLFDLIKTNKLASAKQSQLVEKVQITPEEVRQFYNGFTQEKLPLVEEMYELSEIVIKPIVSQEEKQKVINKLLEIRQDVLDGYSFASRATMYTEDPGSIKSGGYYKINKKTQFVKEFKDVAFSLKEGEISMPFETEFGYHIIYLERIKGSDLEVRHILMSAKPTEEAIAAAKTKVEELRLRILNKEITFADAARMYSDEKTNKANGGLMAFNQEGETRVPLNILVEESQLYYAVNKLQLGEVSQPFYTVNPQTRTAVYKIVELTNKIPEHKADFILDYMEIKERALLDKQQKLIGKWINEKVNDTYIYISDEYKNCEFQSNWLKK